MNSTKNGQFFEKFVYFEKNLYILPAFLKNIKCAITN